MRTPQKTMQVKNHVHVCEGFNASEWPWKDTWAGRKPEACEDIIENQGDAFIRFQHIYSCFENGNGWNAAQGACVFVPKVYVKDNWGWCNGGVYADENSCAVKNAAGLPLYPTAGTSFADQIVIKPYKE